ncbi:MAG: hypothetical protein ABIR56_09390 [Polaromonas sp.]
MTAQASSVGRISYLRRVLSVTLLALAACGNGAGNPGPDTPDVSVSGSLTLKGTEPGAWWAVTDDQGHVWKISAPTPDQITAFQQAQNRRVRVDGRREEKYLNFDQIRPLRIVVAP